MQNGKSGVITLKVNGSEVRFEGDPGAPLLWVIREYLNLTGTKFGCGLGLCGACTIHINGRASRSCITPVAAVANAEIKTIEGLAADDRLHPVQQAWLDIDVLQCGYCQPGQIMAAAALLEENSKPDEDQIASHMSGNLCRCGTYPRIRKAILRASELLREEKV